MQQIIAKQIVYGTISTWLGKRAEDKLTHQWICYVRGPKNEDISYFVEKVVFVLHHSFDQPERVVTQWPFVIQERGWGQFEIQIKIYVKGQFDAPLMVTHMLKLYSSNSQSTPLSRKPVISEQQDEVVFVNPRVINNNYLELVELLSKVPEAQAPEENVQQMEQEEGENQADENVTALQNYKSLAPNFIDFDQFALENKQKLEHALNVINNEFLYNNFKTNRKLDQEIQELESECQNLYNQVHMQPKNNQQQQQ